MHFYGVIIFHPEEATFVKKLPGFEHVTGLPAFIITEGIPQGPFL